jgi:hypothetical protein
MRTALTIWLLALALAVTGCAPAAGEEDGGGVATLDGDGGETGAPSEATSEAVDREEAQLAHAECMREHGVDFPDPNAQGDVHIGPEQAEDPDFRDAEEACEPLLEAAMGDFQPDPEEEARMQEQALAFSECMRDHGIDFPDPVFEEGGARVRIGGGPGEEPAFDPEDPAFQEAQEACEEETNFGPGADNEEEGE